MVATASKPQFNDEFSSDEFNGGEASFPWLMTLNKSKKFGIFTTYEQAMLAGWKDMNYYPNCQHETKGGEALEGFNITQPRLLVICSGEMLRLDKNTGKIVGRWVKGDKDRGFRAAQRFLVMLLDENNQPLHDEPFGWTIKSSVLQAQFSTNLQDFRKEFDDAWAKSRNERRVTKNEKFHALSVFCPELTSKVFGTGANSNSACCVAGRVNVTPENVGRMFVGFNPELKERVFALYEENQGFGKYRQEDGGGDSGVELDTYEVEADYDAYAAPVQPVSLLALRAQELIRVVGFNPGRVRGLCDGYGLPAQSSQYKTDADVLTLRSVLFSEWAKSQGVDPDRLDRLSERLDSLPVANDKAAFEQWQNICRDALATGVGAPGGTATTTNPW